MKAENITLEKIEGIYDIQPLTPPPFSGVELFLIMLALTTLVIVLGYFVWHRVYSRKASAQRNIKKLQRSYQGKKISSHDAVYQLCSQLKHGLNLKQINAENSLTKSLQAHSENWHLFTKNMNALRYSNNKKTEAEIEAAFDDSLFWLKMWR